jgi:hypothetical protein
VFDLSGFDRIECRVTNSGESNARVCLRVDNAGKNNSMTSMVGLPAGQTKTIKARLEGFTGTGEKFDPSKITQLLLFLDRPKAATNIRIERLTALSEDKAAGPLQARPAFDKSKAVLVWQDEFDGEKLDRSKWIVQRGPRRSGFMRADGAYLDGKGHLVLKCDEIDGKYGSGCITTEGKYKKAFGYFEARMKLEKYKGHWPGFWLFASCVNKVGDEGRDGSEIDIMEAPFPSKNAVNHAVHWDGYGDAHSSAGALGKVEGVDLYDGEWHTFAVDWFKNGYVFYVDGHETWRTDAGGVCQVPLGILLSDEIDALSGKGWTDGSVREADLPELTVVDYVRVYEMKE